MPNEVDEMRQWLHRLLTVPAGATVVDLGCGKGDDLRLLAQTYPDARYIGVDRSDEWIRQAEPASNVEFVCGDLSQRLPFEDGTIDAVYSVNLLECLPNPAAFVAECSRVLRPGGQVVVAHYDWDTQTFDGEDRALVRRIVHAFNDWQQAWMEAIDPWAGRRLGRWFGENGSFTGRTRAHTLISDSFVEGSYGRRQAESFEALVRRDMISREDYETFIRFLRESAELGTFMYSVTMFAYIGRKR